MYSSQSRRPGTFAGGSRTWRRSNPPAFASWRSTIAAAATRGSHAGGTRSPTDETSPRRSPTFGRTGRRKWSSSARRSAVLRRWSTDRGSTSPQSSASRARRAAGVPPQRGRRHPAPPRPATHRRRAARLIPTRRRRTEPPAPDRLRGQADDVLPRLVARLGDARGCAVREEGASAHPEVDPWPPVTGPAAPEPEACGSGCREPNRANARSAAVRADLSPPGLDASLDGRGSDDERDGGVEPPQSEERVGQKSGDDAPQPLLRPDAKGLTDDFDRAHTERLPGGAISAVPRDRRDGYGRPRRGNARPRVGIGSPRRRRTP